MLLCLVNGTFYEEEAESSQTSGVQSSPAILPGTILLFKQILYQILPSASIVTSSVCILMIVCLVCMLWGGSETTWGWVGTKAKTM